MSAKQVIALPFYKVHGAGNDMLVFFKKDLPLAARQKSEFIRRFAHRNFGLGSDQVVEVLSLKPLAIQIWNCDGSKAEMCANGSRTFLFLAAREGWIEKSLKRIPLRVSGGQYEGLKEAAGSYELSLGCPKILGEKTLKLGKECLPFVEVNVGNPHTVIFTKNGKVASWKAPKDFDYREYGRAIEPLPMFPNKTNIEFVRDWKIQNGQGDVRVEAWERGAGATLSCGSGAVAVAAVFHHRYGCKVVRIRMTNFVLKVRFENDIAFLSGPCEFIAKGTYSVCHSR